MATDLKVSVTREIDRLTKELAAATGRVAELQEQIKRHELVYDMLDGQKTGRRSRQHLADPVDVGEQDAGRFEVTQDLLERDGGSAERPEVDVCVDDRGVGLHGPVVAGRVARPEGVQRQSRWSPDRRRLGRAGRLRRPGRRPSGCAEGTEYDEQQERRAAPRIPVPVSAPHRARLAASCAAE